MMICKECKNNKDGECKVCIEEDGTFKPISERQVDCGYKDLDIGYDLSNQVIELTKLEELEARLKLLEDAKLAEVK